MKVDIYNTDKRYNIIYADPPWNYKNSPSKKGTTRCFAKNHYNLMSVQELKKLNIDKIADKNSVLFMWATFPMINEALETIRNWGFNYRTCAFVWIKKIKNKIQIFGDVVIIQEVMQKYAY